MTHSECRNPERQQNSQVIQNQLAVKLLCEHNTGETNAGAATCSTATARRCSSAGVCVAVLASIAMFVFGVFLGALLHAIVFSQDGSQLALVNSTPYDPNSVPSQAWPPCNNSSQLNDDDDYLETATDVVYDLSQQEDCSDFPWKDIRLPRDVVPFSYNLTIHPNITTNNLIGSVAIDIEVLNMTKLIVLHHDRIIMRNFRISVNSEVVDAEFYVCPSLSQWAFVLDSEVTPGDIVEVEVEFHGEVLPDLHGLYLSTHTDRHGKQTRSAVTQFEPTYARKMFPCFDEPNFKATFLLSVIREAHHVVRSNMHINVSKEYVDGLYLDVFHRTIKMSTYLLAVAILDSYDYVRRTTRNTRDPIEVRLYAPQNVIKGQSEFSLDTAVRALEYFENYFDISYPLKKIDLVALDDFSEGAMENWGMITFRDSALLYTDGITSAQNKEHIALVICHEVAHQWFGNLVTMDWWNDLWLNEGFANYMEFRCVDRLFPDWNIMTRFYAENVALSHELDGLRSSRAVSSHTFNQTNIIGLFDAISYHKASAIIRMLQSLTGERNFQRSLIQYLNKYAYGNAKGAHLWEIVEKHAVLPHGISIQSLANAYIKQVGCPEIFVTLSDMEIIVHSQTRHFLDGGEEDDTEWPIPIYYRTDAQTESRLQWMKVDHNKMSWPLMKSSKWVVANTDGLSYVKVLYDRKNYAELTNQLRINHTAISAIDRTMILVDAFDFSKSSKLNIEVYLNLLLYATEEMDRLAWMMINKQMKYIESLIEETPFAHIFKDLQRTLILRPYERVGWSTNTSMTPAQKGLQAEVIGTACRLRNRDCVKQAQHQYNQWIINKKRPSPELLGVILNEGVSQGGRAAWDNAYTAYQEAKSPTEKNQLISAMASTTQSTLISRLLRLCLDGSSFRPNTIPRVLSELSKTSVTRALAWRFFRVNYKNFMKMFGDGSNLLVSSLRAMIDKLSTQEDLDEVKAFL
ncbi:hypothetical protein Angca_006404, partial [Angiostrongylus cantonensis]